MIAVIRKDTHFFLSRKEFTKIYFTLPNYFYIFLTQIEENVKITKMNELDQKIAYSLQLKGFESKLIAGDVGVSERTARRHLHRMIKQQMIKVVAISNPVLCGFKAWSKIGIKIEPNYLNSVARTLVGHPAIYFAAYVLGRFDMIIAVHFDTVDKLAYFVNSELVGIRGVVNSETWMLAYPRKYYHFSWPAPVFINSKEEHSFDSESVSNKKYHMDDIDLDIIAVLSEDGLAKLDDIRFKLGLGNSTIRKRIRYMSDNNAYYREVVLSPKMLENETWATVGISTNGRDANEVIDAILKYPTVYLASVSIGKFNIVIAAHFRNIDLLNHFATVELPSIQGIGSAETFVHSIPLKYHSIPLYVDSQVK